MGKPKGGAPEEEVVGSFNTGKKGPAVSDLNTDHRQDLTKAAGRAEDVLAGFDDLFDDPKEIAKQNKEKAEAEEKAEMDALAKKPGTRKFGALLDMTLTNTAVDLTGAKKTKAEVRRDKMEGQIGTLLSYWPDLREVIGDKGEAVTDIKAIGVSGGEIAHDGHIIISYKRGKELLKLKVDQDGTITEPK